MTEPWVVDQLLKLKYPPTKLNYQTSVSISKGKIPVAKPDTYPQSQAVHGIAVWLDVPAKANLLAGPFAAMLDRARDLLTGKSNDDPR